MSRTKICGNPNCRISHGIHEGITFGYGQLDRYGYWEYPCYACARQWENEHPGEQAWPFSKDKELVKAGAD